MITQRNTIDDDGWATVRAQMPLSVQHALFHVDRAVGRGTGLGIATTQHEHNAGSSAGTTIGVPSLWTTVRRT